MRNHLIIGLGGTGGKILRAFRKNIFQEFRRHEPGLVNVRYLYLDSSEEMMALDDPAWTVLGESVQLDRRSQLLITGSDLTTVLDNISLFPSIQPWIGDRQQWRNILGGIIGPALGGQKRRLGRFLFACKAREFQSQLNDLVRDLTTGGETAVTFHVCAGLAGGTGSGSLLDVIALIRAQYRSPASHRIVVYTLLPEEIPPPNWDTGNYHANGFAALLELNALSVRSYRPYNLAGAGERLELHEDPFNGCYLFTNQNENGVEIDLDRQMPGIVADFLFQKIIAIGNTEAAALLERMENAENGDGTPETRPGANVPERARRFLTFGLKRLAIPETEIREYLTYKFAWKAALQLRFNHWDDDLGFLDRPRGQDFDAEVRQPQNLERWGLTDDHLTLSRGILPEETRSQQWKPLPREWTDVMPRLVSLSEGSSDPAGWLDELDKLAAQRFNETFRGQGVLRFYEGKGNVRRQHAASIRSRIETELFGEWANGTKSTYDVARQIDALAGLLDERLDAMDRKIADASEYAAKAERRAAANRAEGRGVGVFSQMFGRRRALLAARGECLRDLYVARTQVEAFVFAKRLLNELSAQMTQFATDIGLCTARLDEAVREFAARIEERCNDDDQPDLRQSLVRYYRPASVKELAGRLDKDEGEQKRQAQVVRTTLIEQLGSEPTFAAFPARLTRQRLLDVMEKRCEESARNAHDNLVAVNRDYAPLFGVNVISRLEREFSGHGDALRKFLHDFVNHSGYFLEFDPQEAARSGPGIPGGAPPKVQQFMVILPRDRDQSAFAAEMRRMLLAQFPGGVPVKVVESNDKPNEITIIGLANLFPARYVRRVRFLQGKYEARIAGSDQPERVRLEIHGEGDGTKLPELFVPNQEKLVQRTLPYLMLAKVMDMMQPATDPSTGLTELFLVEEDEYGLPTHTRLGRSLPDVSQSLGFVTAQRFQDGVNQRLAGEGYRHVDKRTELQGRLKAELKTVLKECKNNFQDPVYNRFKDATREAIQLVKT